MRTNKFETHIKDQLEPVGSNWVTKLKEVFSNIIVREVLNHCTQIPNGKLYKTLVHCDLNFRDEMIIMTIAQDRDKLEFFYFGVPPDESSDECLFELTCEYLEFMRSRSSQESTEL
jgi:hypothetical protein